MYAQNLASVNEFIGQSWTPGIRPYKIRSPTIPCHPRKAFQTKRNGSPISTSFHGFQQYQLLCGCPFGIQEERLQLLVNVTGAFRPGVLTALVGVSGAGKTTLMDVLAGKKTGGVIEGNTYISGYPKRQDSFARISGYCEQTDVHFPCLIVWESLLFSAWLQLYSDVDFKMQKVWLLLVKILSLH
ncbi:ABC transporter G family member 32-like [Arachis stenosperma]|uniref:ABC transporter G family member 32-like n=1 Tax=Arachis stenosperma TaxID=217475 RepID=UPI0025ACA3A4|nr:ABC transporter G family member 32-like [Arachis stenosperma]